MSALDGWPAVEPWLCRRSRELVITRTWCTVTARKTTTAITTSWPLNTRSAARAIRIPEPNCSSLTLSAPESAERDVTAGSTVSLSIPPGRRRRLHLQEATSFRSRSRSRPQTWEIRQELPNSFPNPARRPSEVYPNSLYPPSSLFRPAVKCDSGVLFFRPPCAAIVFGVSTPRSALVGAAVLGKAGAWQRWPD